MFLNAENEKMMELNEMGKISFLSVVVVVVRVVVVDN